MQFIGTTNVEGKTLHLYGFTTEELSTKPRPVVVVPDLSPTADALVEGILDSIPGRQT